MIRCQILAEALRAFYKMRPKAATMQALLIGGGWPIGRVMGRRKAKCRVATPVNAAKPPHAKPSSGGDLPVDGRRWRGAPDDGRLYVMQKPSTRYRF